MAGNGTDDVQLDAQQTETPLVDGKPSELVQAALIIAEALVYLGDCIAGHIEQDDAAEPAQVPRSLS